MKFFFSFLLLPLFVFTACASYTPLLVMVVEDGRQQYFIRPETLAKGGVECTIDFTVLLNKNKIDNNVLVNYTLGMKEYSYAEMEKTTLTLVSDTGEFPVAIQDILYRNPSSNQIRVSALLSAQSMTQFIDSATTFSIRIHTADNKEYNLFSKQLQEKLFLLQKSLL